MTRPANRQDYWFKARRYGWGWTPVTWQAWSLLAAYLIVVGGSTLVLLPATKSESTNFVDIVALILIFFSATSFLIGLAILKGQRPAEKKLNKE